MTMTDRTCSAEPADPGFEKADPPKSWVVRAAAAAIRAYQAARAGHPSPCRYWPSCSVYAEEAIGRHGLWRGGRLAARRLLRCHPFGGHGVDPVPDGRLVPRGERS
jgi:putative membrane protein insertion efficiency factor